MIQQKKLTEEELNVLKKIYNEYNKIMFQVGEIEYEKNILLKNAEMQDIEYKKTIEQLHKKYGEGTINLENGEIS